MGERGFKVEDLDALDAWMLFRGMEYRACDEVGAAQRVSKG